MKRSTQLLGVLLLALAAITATGCAITDFEGYPGHQTSAESKLWSQEISFLVGDPAYDGTYAYTVKYNNHNGHDVNMKIFTYRNPVDSSFSRDGQIDRDGDDVQGRAGILGGKFLPQWTVTDPATDCQFFANNIQSQGGSPAPLLALCATINEEIDKDLELQTSFASLGDMINQIWSGAVSGNFTAELTGVRLGNTNVTLSQPLSIGARSNGVRPTRITVDLTGPAGHELIQSILNNTSDGVPVSLRLNFAGGMAIDLPNGMKVVFNRQALGGLL